MSVPHLVILSQHLVPSEEVLLWLSMAVTKLYLLVLLYYSTMMCMKFVISFKVVVFLYMSIKKRKCDFLDPYFLTNIPDLQNIYLNIN